MSNIFTFGVKLIKFSGGTNGKVPFEGESSPTIECKIKDNPKSHNLAVSYSIKMFYGFISR